MLTPMLTPALAPKLQHAANGNASDNTNASADASANSDAVLPTSLPDPHTNAIALTPTLTLTVIPTLDTNNNAVGVALLAPCNVTRARSGGVANIGQALGRFSPRRAAGCGGEPGRGGQPDEAIRFGAPRFDDRFAAGAR